MAMTGSGGGYLSAGIVGMPNTSGAMTICGWFNISSITNAVNSWVNIVANSSGAGVQMGSRTNQAKVWRYGGTDVVAFTVNPTVGVLHHIAYTSTGSVHNLYLDGDYKDFNNTVNASGAAETYEIFGNQYNENTAIYIDDLRVYNRTLSAGEISQIYYGRSRDTMFFGLVSRHRFNEGAPTTHPGSAASIKDLTINANHGITFTDSLSGYTYNESYLRYRQNFRAI